MVIYGITTCGSVKKAIAFCKANNLEYDFVDMRQEPITGEKIDQWLSYVDIDTLFNSRGTKYRTLGLKEFKLDDEAKREWLIKRICSSKDQLLSTIMELVLAMMKNAISLYFLCFVINSAPL